MIVFFLFLVHGIHQGRVASGGGAVGTMTTGMAAIVIVVRIAVWVQKGRGSGQGSLAFVDGATAVVCMLCVAGSGTSHGRLVTVVAVAGIRWIHGVVLLCALLGIEYCALSIATRGILELQQQQRSSRGGYKGDDTAGSATVNDPG